MGACPGLVTKGSRFVAQLRLTIRAPGRNHLAEPASRSHRKAVFQLNSQIPLRSTQFRVDHTWVPRMGPTSQVGHLPAHGN